MPEETITQILMRRDNLSVDEANDLLEEAREQVRQGANPEEVCEEMFGLEPDYIWELFD